MMRSLWLSWACPTFLGVLLLANGVPAQTPPGAPKTAAPALQPAPAPPAAPAAQAPPTSADTDPAFSRFIDMEVLGAAWGGKNAELLTDCALMLADGEKVLMRPHKAITADQVFTAAVRVAAERKDKASLTRLSKALTALGKTELAGEAKLAAQFADKSRAVDPALNVPADASPAVFMLLHETIKQIKSMKLAQNMKGIEALAKEIPTMSELSEAQRRALLKMAKDAQSSVPAETDPLAAALNKLSDESRKGGGGGGHGGGGGGGGGHGGGGGGAGHGGFGGGGGAGHGGGGGGAGHGGGGHGGQHRYGSLQGHWQRVYSGSWNCYLYWDGYCGCWYRYDDSCGCYSMLDDQ